MNLFLVLGGVTLGVYAGLTPGTQSRWLVAVRGFCLVAGVMLLVRGMR